MGQAESRFAIGSFSVNTFRSYLAFPSQCRPVSCLKALLAPTLSVNQTSTPLGDPSRRHPGNRTTRRHETQALPQRHPGQLPTTTRPLTLLDLNLRHSTTPLRPRGQSHLSPAPFAICFPSTHLASKNSPKPILSNPGAHDNLGVQPAPPVNRQQCRSSPRNDTLDNCPVTDWCSLSDRLHGPILSTLRAFLTC